MRWTTDEDGTIYRHTKESMEQKRQDFEMWYFDPFKEQTSLKLWAQENHVSYRWALQARKEPSFVNKMEEFRKTHREDGELALQNLIRFAHSSEPRAAIPAIKILVEVMGYNAPQKLEVTTKGMSLADYLVYIQQQELKVQTGAPALEAQTPINGEFSEIEVDQWETVDA